MPSRSGRGGRLANRPTTGTVPVVLSLSQATKDENKRIKALERDPQRKEKALAAAAALLVLTTKAEAIPRDAADA